MRIALVTSDPVQAGRQADQASGTDQAARGQRIVSLGRALADHGHQVTIYSRADSAGPHRAARLSPGLTTEPVAVGPAGPLADERAVEHLASFSGTLAERWQQDRPDVVHAHYWTAGLAALTAAREVPVPVVQTFHELAGSRRGTVTSVARKRLEPVIARSVSAVLAGTSAELAALTRLGVPRAAVRVVPCGVDTSTFAPVGPVARRTRRPRLLAMAAQAADHGLDVVLNALPRLPGTELLIAGGPPKAQLSGDPELRELAALAKRRGISDRVLFTGEVSAARLPALLRSADLLVHVAADEPLGLVPLQAMACGTPVVAAAGGSYHDAVVDGATGLLVPAGQAGELARRIRQLLATPMLLQGYGIAAADRATARYSWDRIGQETLAVYERSLTTRREAAA
ncbi:MAG TPA: glycosyltransferase [Streptosporangiaceae bacterium]